MNAQTLNCHGCGAAVSSEAPNCEHCGARLASIACPACFAMMFQGSKFCPHCGSPAVQWESDRTDWPCPSCRLPMLRGKLGEVSLQECEKCYGLWLGTAAFEQICRNAEHEAGALGSAQPAGGPAALSPVRYVRCPQCSELMNRLNFAHCSGVIVDVCRAHGTWFDTDELHRIVQFIRAGGLDRSRAKEKAEIAEERHRLQVTRMGAEPAGSYVVSAARDPDLFTMVIRASGDLLTSWLRR